MKRFYIIFLLANSFTALRASLIEGDAKSARAEELLTARLAPPTASSVAAASLSSAVGVGREGSAERDVKRTADTLLYARPSLFSLSMNFLASQIDLSRPESRVVMHTLIHKLPDTFLDTLAVHAGREYVFHKQLSKEDIGGARPIAFSPSGDLVAIPFLGRSIRIFNLKTYTSKEWRLIVSSRLHSLIFNYNGTKLTGLLEDGCICRWNFLTGEKSYTVRPERYEACASHPSANIVAYGFSDGSIMLEKDDKVLKIFKHYSGGVTTLAFSLNGEELASGGDNGKMYVWDIERGALKRTLIGDADCVFSVAYDVTQTRLLVWGASSLKCLNLLSCEQVWSNSLGGISQCNDVTFSKNGSRIAVFLNNGRYQIIDGENGHVVAVILEKCMVSAVGLNSQGTVIRSGCIFTRGSGY